MRIVSTVTTVIALSLSLSGLAYAKHDKVKSLPPGLQKKVQSGKALPPGWQKKLAVGDTLSRDIYRNATIYSRDHDRGLVTISAEGKLIRVIQNTREIVDIIESF